MRRFFAISLLLCLVGAVCSAQELPPPEKQAKVIFENDQVRILRFTYMPGDKAALHSHPDNVAIALTDSHVRVTSPDGKVTESTGKAWSAKYRPAFQDAVENIGDKPYEGVIVELKCKPTAVKQAASK